MIDRRRAYARTNVAPLQAETVRELAIIRAALNAPEGSEVDEAFAGLETFCAVALRILAKCPPSLVKSEAMTVEIGLRMGETQEIAA